MEGDTRTETDPVVVEQAGRPGEIGSIYIQDLEAGLSALSRDKANSLFGHDDVVQALRMSAEVARRHSRAMEMFRRLLFLAEADAGEVLMRRPARPTLAIALLARCVDCLPKGARRDIAAMAADQDAEIRQLRLEGKRWAARLGIAVTWLRATRLAMAFGVGALVRMVVGAFKS